MGVIEYLKKIYGYGVPIFLKDIRIGRKSKTAIRKELSRAVKQKLIVREAHGIYYFEEENKEFPSVVSFNDIIEKKYIKDDFGIKGFDVNIYGYYSGQTFLHHFGISQQVPAIIEITTNKCTCKRTININGRMAILRKGKTEIDHTNWKILQFLDMISMSLNDEEIINNKKLLKSYITKYLINSNFHKYIKLYSQRVRAILDETGLSKAFGNGENMNVINREKTKTTFDIDKDEEATIVNDGLSNLENNQIKDGETSLKELKDKYGL